MPELTVKEIETVRDIPGNPPAKGGPAKILRVSFEGDDRQPELFATAKTNVPSVGQKVDETRLTFNKQWDRWEFAKQQNAQSGGGFKRSPEETKKIQRQHSQEMALRREANLGAKWTGEQLRSVINWFEQDIATKDRAVTWDGLTDDVPADIEDLSIGGSS